VTDILDKLKDLHKQATTERSHYYVASCCVEAIAEITELRAKLAAIHKTAEAQPRG
jgi:hypothetical protein